MTTSTAESGRSPSGGGVRAALPRLADEMRASPLARRYALPALACVLLLLAALLFPSTAATPRTRTTARSGGAGAGTTDPAAAAAAAAIEASSPAAIAAAKQAAAVAAATRARGGTVIPGGGIGGSGALTGDTSHCKDGRQFATLFYAPPCVARFAGVNGGSTATGVDRSTITVVHYLPHAGTTAGLDQAADVASTDDNEIAFGAAAEKFINANYELYGRHVNIVFYKGNCSVNPPDDPCLRGDMDDLVGRYHPFFVIYNVAQGGAALDELSLRLHVANAGGWHFTDSYASQMSPFHYDAFMSGSHAAKILAEYWCKRLAGKPAKYAGDASLQATTRRLGVVTSNEAENERMEQELTKLVSGCGGGVVAHYEYYNAPDQGVSGAQAAIARMTSPSDGRGPVTTVLCLCPGVQSSFVVATADANRYNPEYFLSGLGLADLDAAGRVIGRSPSWQRAFGPSLLPNMGSYSNDDAATVWRAAGNTGDAPSNSLFVDWKYYEMMAGMFQMAGPTLTPDSLRAGAGRLGARGGDVGHELRQLGGNVFGWQRDIRDVHWCGSCISAIDGKPGAYVALDGGRRYQAGQLPAGEPQFTPSA